MRKLSALSAIALSILLLAGCATAAPERITVKEQVQNCMNSFLEYASENFPDDPRLNPENAKEFDAFVNELQGKCEADQKEDPEGFYTNYGVVTDNSTNK